MSTATPMDARPPRPALPGRATRTGMVAGYHLRGLRASWQGGAVSTIGVPLLFLGALGLGLGTLVDAGGQTAALGGLRYAAYAGTGVLAATSMQTAAGESAWPVRGAIKHSRTYDALLATPLQPADLVLGHLLYLALRLAVPACVFGIALVVLAGVAPVGALAAVPVAVLTGMAFAGAVMAYCTAVEADDQVALLFRLGILPVFLLSGTFFPIDQLPGWLQPVAVLSPLWHAVELTRAVALGFATAWPWGAHLALLLACGCGGAVAAVRATQRRLRS